MKHASEIDPVATKQLLLTGDNLFWHELVIEQYLSYHRIATGYGHVSLDDKTIDDNEQQQLIQQQTQQRSLFDEPMMYIVRLSKSPKTATTKLICEIVANGNPIVISLAITSQKKTTAVTSLNKPPIVVATTNKLSSSQLRRWVTTQIHTHDLKADNDIIQRLCEYNSDDPYLIKQDIHMLSILYPTTTISQSQLDEVITPKLLPSIFNIGDLAFQGSYQQASVALKLLKQQNQSPILILSFISKMIIQLIQLYSPPFSQSLFNQRCRSIGIWQSHQQRYRHYKRTMEQLKHYLKLAMQVDRDIKSNHSSSSQHWQNLHALVWQIAKDSLLG